MSASVSASVPVSVTTPRTTTTRRSRTSTRSATFTPTPSATPYDATSDRQADNQRTNKILIGVFTGFGVLFLGLVAFQLLRCYKRRRQASVVPLPPPRDPMSQLGYRQSRAVSMYKDFPAPSPGFSRPQSMMVRDPSNSGFFGPPSIHSSAASMEKLRVDESGRLSTDPGRSPFQGPHEDSPDNSLSAIIPADEETGRRLSPLGSRSQSPSNLSMPRRAESRARYPRPNSVASTSRHSYLSAPNWQHRNTVHGSVRPGSYYGNGNHGAPHTPHARDRVGLMMPQPLAPELFNYALGGRHDMGLDFMQGTWESRQNLAHEQDLNAPLVAPRRVRTDSWVGQSHTPSDSPSTSDAPSLPAKDRSLPRGRSTRPDIPRP